MSHDFEVYAISFNYGQRHKIELTRAYELAGIMGCKNHIVVHIPNQIVAKGSLAGRGESIPEGHYADDNMASTIVPNRNALMLASAFAWAETLGAEAVGIGVHAGDHPVYPDCRPEFLDAFEHMEHLALGRPVRLYRPFANVGKHDIVKLGASLGLNAPTNIYGRTWSCYNPQTAPVVIGEINLEPLIHCGRCGTCVERKEAFVLAQVQDPTRYADPFYIVQANQSKSIAANDEAALYVVDDHIT